MITPQLTAWPGMTPRGFPDNFTRYMLEFYGPNGIYRSGFTALQIRLATQLYRTRLAVDYPGQEFEGDSVDPERVRDTIIQTCRSERV
jgi:hypothetical protein